MRPGDDRFPVVGIGASAGGLEAFSRLLDALPADSGMAFILVQHLDPTHASMMVDLLAVHTRMVVLQADSGMPLAPDHVYVIPPGVNLSIKGGAIHLSDLRERHGSRLPFDFFLRSLAEEFGERAICAILSGSGSDGSLGLKAVAEKGGLVIAQDPSEAAYDGMPQSAIATGAVDLVLPLAEMAASLVKYGKQAYVKIRHAEAPAGDDRVPDGLTEIIDLLRQRSSHDFSLYKQGTLLRRTERRMAIAGVKSKEAYLELLRTDPGALDALAKDFFIHVTSFFRDPKTFEALAESVIPQLVVRPAPGEPLRIWVPGCSSGEETYSLAMLFIEAIDAVKRNIKLQVFASDVDAATVDVGRSGFYPESIESDITPSRLARFFTKESNSYRVVRELREAVIFTVQDVLADAPFSRLDLVSCRNLLIYLRPEVQEKVILLFHYALREGGILLLGNAETVGRLGTHFKPISKQQHVYRHVGRSRPGEVQFPIGAPDTARTLWPRAVRRTAPQRTSRGDVARQILAEAYVPASVLVNRRHECLHAFGPTDRYLQVTAGEPSRDLITMAREGLRVKLRSALHQASRGAEPTTVTGARVTRDGKSFAVIITVRPLEIEGEGLLLVSFLDETKPRRQHQRAGTSAADGSRLSELEQELDSTRKELEVAVRELDTATEEYKSINEEAMSVNEEFQSSNEELETSKEELQSLNEELTTLNHQLQETLERQRDTANDMQNILNSSNVATLFLDADLNIRFFTPSTKSLFRLIASDIGRPLADFTPHFIDKMLLADAGTVLADLVPIGREIQTDDGAWYMRRMMPYRTVDNRIDGVVITFADISEMKAVEQDINATRALKHIIIDAIRQPLVVLDDELRVIDAGRSFYSTFKTTAEDTIGHRLWNSDDHHLDVPALHAFLQKIRLEGGVVENYEIEIDLPSLGKRTLLLDANDIRPQPQSKRKILVAIEDITERRQAETALGSAKGEAEQANLVKSRFLAAASHDLRQPLQTISLMQGLLLTRVKDEKTLQLVNKLGDTVSAMSGMLDALLDINQLEAGIVRPDMVDFPINELLDRLKAEFAYHAESKNLGWRVVPCGLSVHGDRRLFEQMMRNLLSNAVKYTERGKILVGCRRRGAKLRVEVWDTGIGIPADQLRSIFEEFHQLNNPARELSLGLGLGLSLVQRLGALLGVSVDVRSRPGRGSVFAVEVPLARGEGEALAAPARHQAAEPTARRGSILVIEDDPGVRDLLEMLLQDEGHVVAVAADGRQALELGATLKFRPDIIFADYNLPGGMTGLQIVMRLREMLNLEIPAVILTGDISTSTALDIAPTGCVQLNKPVRMDDVTLLIQRLLAVPNTSRPRTTALASVASEASSAATVFIVDNDATLLEAMRMLLEQRGRKVEVYPDAKAFLDAYRAGRKGCLVVDARLPGMDGLALMDRLKAEGHELPTIMITGHGDVPTAVRALKAGAVDFMEKPFRHEAPLASIEHAMKPQADFAALSSWPEAPPEAAQAHNNGMTRR